MTLTQRLPRPRRSDADTYPSRQEAVEAAREFFWGSRTVRGCKFRVLDTSDYPHFGTFVTADVNGRLILIDFDNFGRATVGQVD